MKKRKRIMMANRNYDSFLSLPSYFSLVLLYHKRGWFCKEFLQIFGDFFGFSRQDPHHAGWGGSIYDFRFIIYDWEWFSIDYWGWDYSLCYQRIMKTVLLPSRGGVVGLLCAGILPCWWRFSFKKASGLPVRTFVWHHCRYISGKVSGYSCPEGVILNM